MTHTRAAREYNDFDYVDKLNDEEKVWLSKFAEEYYNNTFKNGPGKLNHHKKDERKKVYDQTNARNRDMYNQRYRLYDEPEWGGMDYYGTASPENAFIETLDRSRRVKEFVEQAMKVESNEEFLEQLTWFVFSVGE